ncbi:MAG: Hsp20/alpha crystallin family protein [Hydrogenovibrio sp.]|uniref:Hsp20/alpha crystallin family protein n=1 Tax=Hydrogenovibrio sp. TaxID=2065821 RepID=UPI0028707017|nr:Hsp20/alpha crystallin family protein [Hydrogenovibrio sp.]MDR9498792.1 Hsp20/alpha crystallin family protein [Hydrogenovibrio sp.]
MARFLTTFDPFREIRDMQSRLQQAFPAQADSGESSVAGFVPTVNTREGDYAYHIEADLPGVKKEDIQVEVKDGRVAISGERKVKDEVNEDDYYRVESRYGKFERSFALPDNVDEENVNARCEDGVLEVVLPKKQTDDTSKKITVE